MSDMKVDTVRSSNSGVVGRAQSEAFLAGVSSCGVTLIEGHAKDTGVPMRSIQVTIEGARPAAEPNRFATVTMTFEIAGVSAAQADELVATYRGR